MKGKPVFLFISVFFILMCDYSKTRNNIILEMPEKPVASNTGPVSTLFPYGSEGRQVITNSGTVMENFELNGYIEICTSDVIIRNFIINAEGEFYGIKISDDYNCKNIIIEYGEIYNMGSCAILGIGYTARYLNIHESEGDALKVQGTNAVNRPTIVEYCYLHHLGKSEGAHADGNQTQNPEELTGNVIFRYNNFDLPDELSSNWPGEPYKVTSCFILNDIGPGFVIDSNWLNGGGYTIYCPEDVERRTYLTITNNRFGRDYGFGIITSGPPGIWSGNIWDDTGDEIEY